MPRELTFETMSAKEAKNRFDCSGNHLGYSNEADRGLQCGLSGNRVAYQATMRLRTERGTASIGNERCAAGKANPTYAAGLPFAAAAD